jgi:asparagine synthase (glutamine-hydrolysing)
MTVLCGWLASEPGPHVARVIEAMGLVLRSRPEQVWGRWSVQGLGVGLLEVAGDGDAQARYAPAVSGDGRHYLWFAGEAFDGGSSLSVPDPESTRTVAFRDALLDLLLKKGVDAVRELDGEYQIVWWDAHERALTMLNDRFGGLPLYWARTPQGFAWAGGVRGVLMAPGVPADPDPAALREAVSFGGYRLGNRTNVAAVKMLAGASVVTVRHGAPTFRRYWSWSDIEPREAGPAAELIDEAHDLWQLAIGRRLHGATRPGQTLSGGLDSRAILAEAAPRCASWTAITYGLPGCDDALYAQRAAAALQATWVFHPLYGGRDPDWLGRRTACVQDTDGLIQLVDLMHLEALDVQARLLDVHLSGYIGDAVSGPTFGDVRTPDDVLGQLPYYGTSLGLDWAAALARVRPLVAEVGAAPARFAIFEHKLPQSTNRWTAAWRPWLRVRKPFVDYRLFDFWQGLPDRARTSPPLYHRWLTTRYPSAFAAIPYQKTGAAVLAPAWRVQLARAGRVAWRLAQPTLTGLGVPARPRLRSYFDDEAAWRTPDARSRIEGTILRPGSLCCEILGRAAVSAAVSAWFDQLALPTQVIGALYVFEAYHRDLPARLHAAAEGAR